MKLMTQDRVKMTKKDHNEVSLIQNTEPLGSIAID